MKCATVHREPRVGRSKSHAVPDVGHVPNPIVFGRETNILDIHAERQLADPSPHPADLLLQYILAVQDALVGQAPSVANTDKHKRHRHIKNEPPIAGPVTARKREPNPTAQWAQNVRYVLTTPAFVPQNANLSTLLISSSFLPYIINLPPDFASPSFASILKKAIASPGFATTFSGFLCLMDGTEALLPEGIVREQFKGFCDGAATKDWSKGVLVRRRVEMEEFARNREDVLQ
ncbi:hypothetical protein GP486_001133 [Trichoglossum hirsutum]|uniref:Uncharacterized protein n=1 Tax=Trichoglossum hirsutum TaxID=265104 RepID=A0A9P8RTE0_9PEZI|nr:hypothetical protein GP486_001133 [Trichoglossum hirsutum]